MNASRFQLLTSSPLSLLWFVMVAANPLYAETPPLPQTWAVIAAVKSHDNQRLNNLDYTLHDAQELRRILVERGGVPSDHVLELTDLSAVGLRSRLTDLQNQVPPFLRSPRIGRHDRVLVFFSGHGVLVDGKTCLVPSDVDVNRLRETCWPLEELRDVLKQCIAETKVVVLDCCHAGGLAGNRPTGPAPEELRRDFDPDVVPGCMLLASCKKNELSLEWPHRKQGVFTYWLARALEGGGDVNRDGQLSIGEIYNYTSERVSSTALVVHSRKQNPVRFINTDIEGDPILLSLSPEAPETLCRRLAEQLDLEIRRSKLKHVGVIELVTVVGGNDSLAPAALPRFLADRLRVSLATLAEADGEYRVFEMNVIQQSLGQKNIVLDQIGNPAAMQRLRQALKQLDGLVWGRLDRRGMNLSVQCELLDRNSQTVATPTGMLSGMLGISEDLQGDMGVSFDNRQRPAGSPNSITVVEHVDLEAQSHPALKPDFPFKVEVWSVQPVPGEAITEKTPRRKKEPVLRPRPNDLTQELLIPASAEELFEIHVENQYGHDVAMTLLIDGLNSLGQGRERLGHARSWIVRRPAYPELLSRLRQKKQDGTLNEAENRELVEEEDRARRRHPHVFDSWLLDDPVGDANARRFKFTQLANAVAARQRFQDSIGLITAAFYAERGRALGVGEGPEEKRDLKTVDFKVGRLLGVVQIRYVEEQELNRILNKP